MSQDLHQHAEEIFSEAIDRSGKARSDFLARTCGDDPELRNEVDSLISHYESTENVLTSRGGSSHSISAGPDDELNLTMHEDGAEVVIGSYRIVEVLEESELGTAYLVEQEPSSQSCRLDLYRPMIDRTGTMRRFQVLGERLMSLSLPCCTTILEAGTTDTGRGRQPFAVSVHSSAPTLLNHAGQSGLTVEARIDLLQKACETVRQLHRAGLIHGDLRPATVIVEPDGMPSLLDAGIAHALQLPHSLAVEPDEGISNEFQAPEQAEGIFDTLGDVYALGRLGQALLEDGDNPTLQAVCSKACATSPSDRYSSVDAMVRDLERYRRNEPLDAAAAGFVDECRALARRHPTSTACSVIALAIVLLMCLAIGAFAFSTSGDLNTPNANDASTTGQ